MSTQARQARQAREHASTSSTRARQARDLADSFLSVNIEIVKGNKTKTCINKSFDVIIIRILLAFTVQDF